MVGGKNSERIVLAEKETAVAMGYTVIKITVLC
jgi:hypothetical protein